MHTIEMLKSFMALSPMYRDLAIQYNVITLNYDAYNKDGVDSRFCDIAENIISFLATEFIRLNPSIIYPATTGDDPYQINSDLEIICNETFPTRWPIDINL
jgi:hypothetical protein